MSEGNAMVPRTLWRDAAIPVYLVLWELAPQPTDSRSDRTLFITRRALCDRLGITRPDTITSALSRLEACGWLRRDRRTFVRDGTYVGACLEITLLKRL